MIYFKLFLSFLQIGLFSIGGGYAALPLIQEQVVEINKWLTLTEFTDLIIISEMTPGPIAINSATFVGTRIAGMFGSVAATFGFLLPSMIIGIILAKLYFGNKEDFYVQSFLSGLRPVVVAFITGAGISILTLAFYGENPLSYALQNIDISSVIIFIISLFILVKFKPNPTSLIFLGGIVGTIIYFIV